MPVYKFNCDNCGTVFEMHFHMGDDMSGAVYPIFQTKQIHLTQLIKLADYQPSNRR